MDGKNGNYLKRSLVGLPDVGQHTSISQDQCQAGTSAWNRIHPKASRHAHSFGTLTNFWISLFLPTVSKPEKIPANSPQWRGNGYRP